MSTMFHAVDKGKIPDKVASQLRRLILNDRLPPGSRLPPERQLADTLGTNRNTLREATRLLREEGLLQVKQGGGTEVADWRSRGGIQLLCHYLQEVEDSVSRLRLLGEALELRREALAMVAQIAAVRGDHDGCEGLRRALQHVHEAAPSERLQADIEFIRALVAATRSQVLTWLVNSLLNALRPLLQNPTVFVCERDYHRNLAAIVSAVEARDPTAAKDATIKHFSAVDELLSAAAEDWMRDTKGGSQDGKKEA